MKDFKCLIDGRAKSHPCSTNCHLFGDCVTAFHARKEKPKPKPMTNADHIRSKSDEELAEFLADYKAEVSRELGVHYSDTSLYKEAALNFLKQPHKENTDE